MFSFLVGRREFFLIVLIRVLEFSFIGVIRLFLSLFSWLGVWIILIGRYESWVWRSFLF